MKCVCGKFMHKVNTHLNYVVWKCSFCGRKEVLWKGTDPWNAKKRLPPEPVEDEVKKEITFSIGDALNEVLNNIYRDEPRSYDEWEEP